MTTSSSLLNSLRQAQTEQLANSTTIRRHGEKFFLVVKGSVVKDGVTFLVGDEPFRGLSDIMIHVKDPSLPTVKRGNEIIELRKFSELMNTGAVRLNDMVVFKDVEEVTGTDAVYLAHSYDTPFNSYQSEEAVKSTSVTSGYMSIEGKEYPQIVLYQTNPQVVGTLAELFQMSEQARKDLLIDGSFMANLQSEEDLKTWASAQFALKRPVTIRAIVAGEDGARESIGVKVNPVSVPVTSQADGAENNAVYRVNSVDDSMAAFMANADVQRVVSLLRVAKQHNLKVDKFENGGAMMLEGIPTLRVNDAYKNIAGDYARYAKNVFERRSVTLPELNRPVLQDVALQGVLITKTVALAEPTGPRAVVRVGPGSGLLQSKTHAYMISELPTPNFPASSEMGEIRDHDQYSGANRGTKDDELLRTLAAKFGAASQLGSAATLSATQESLAAQFKSAPQLEAEPSVRQAAPEVQQPVVHQQAVQAAVNQQPVVQQQAAHTLAQDEHEFGHVDVPADDAANLEDLDQALSMLSLGRR